VRCIVVTTSCGCCLYAFPLFIFHLTTIGLARGHRKSSSNLKEVIGDDAESNPLSYTRFTPIQAAVEAVSPFEHANASFGACAPPYSLSKPSLTFVVSSCFRSPTFLGQANATHAKSLREFFIVFGSECSIGGSQVGSSAENPLMVLQGWFP
jgi:hypothetical protein